MAEKKDKAAPKAAAKKTEPVAKKPADAKGSAPKAAKPAKPAAPKGTPTPPRNDPRGRHRALTGFVRSDKMDKTVVVEVTSLRRDAVYGKYLKTRSRYKAHDEKNQYKTGDKVEIREHRPLSKEKHWIVSRMIEAAKVE
jgi:small subunit ribosomal protein S17